MTIATIATQMLNLYVSNLLIGLGYATAFAIAFKFLFEESDTKRAKRMVREYQERNFKSAT